MSIILREEPREIKFTKNINPYAAGSVIAEFGNTKVQNYLDTHKKALKERIPNIYAWLNYPDYYKALFEQINKSIQPIVH